MSNNECFVDCGAYNGDTIKKFLAKCNNKYDNIVAFEPDNDNFQVLKENYQSPSVYVYNSGVWSTNTVLKFSSNNNVSSNFNENGEEEVKVVALDNAKMQHL